MSFSPGQEIDLNSTSYFFQDAVRDGVIFNQVRSGKSGVTEVDDGAERMWEYNMESEKTLDKLQH